MVFTSGEIRNIRLVSRLLRHNLIVVFSGVVSSRVDQHYELTGLVIFIPVSIRSDLVSHFSHQRPALRSAWVSRDGKNDGTLETPMRFDWVESVATARAYHETLYRSYRELFDENWCY